MSKKNKQAKTAAKERNKEAANVPLTDAYFICKRLYPGYAEWLDKQFYMLQQKHKTYYEDNYRVSIVGDAAAEREYLQVLGQGCCGFIDEVVTYKNIQFKVGFNYGH